MGLATPPFCKRILDSMIDKLKRKTQRTKLGSITIKMFTHPLFAGSAVMIIGSNLSNFIAYIYHLILGRILGPSSYSDLAALLAILGMFTTAFVFMGMVVVKFVSAGKKSEISGLYNWFSKRAIILGIVLAAVLFITTPLISSFLHMDYTVVRLIGPILFFFILSLVYRSFLQGLLRFKQVVLSVNAEFLARLVFGVTFVLLGYSIFGATMGILISSVIGFALSWLFLRKIKLSSGMSKFTQGREIVLYAIPIFLISIGKNSLFSTDVLLVKHFFEPFNAGLYAALSTLGKVIFFGTAPVASVMFPMVSKKQSKGEPYQHIFLLSFFLTLVITAGVLLIYWIFPELMVNILYGEEYLPASEYLVWFGLFMAIFSLSSLTASFYLARGKTKIAIPVIIAAVLQAVGIWFFHDSLISVIYVSILSVSFLLAILLIYFGYEVKAGKFKK